MMKTKKRNTSFIYNTVALQGKEERKPKSREYSLNLKAATK